MNQTPESNRAVAELLVAMGDDELLLGHRNAEWTGHAPILEEDLAFSNVAQDEIGHALVWYTLHEQITGRSPDWMGFERPAEEFRCSRFVTYPKGDFAYTVVRQYLFDESEQVRLQALLKSSYSPLQAAAEKILKEEAYHLLHSKGLVERLGDATEESHRRMQMAVDAAFPQALGLFEALENEAVLAGEGIISLMSEIQQQWLDRVVPVLMGVSLKVPASRGSGGFEVKCTPDDGGRRGKHDEHLISLLNDLQLVYQSIPSARW